MSTYKLCYVDEPWAWFTTQDVKDQWGDDWNDAPYEHNAGPPYSPFKNCKDNWNEDGTPKWSVMRVAYDGPFDTPCSGGLNSRYSVEAINAGAIAWLSTSSWTDKHVNIHAGESLESFIAKVKEAGGRFYLEVQV